MANNDNARVLARTCFVANRLIEECQLMLDEETDTVPKDGLKKKEIIEKFRELNTVDAAKKCKEQFGSLNGDLNENLGIFIKYF